MPPSIDLFSEELSLTQSNISKEETTIVDKIEDTIPCGNNKSQTFSPTRKRPRKRNVSFKDVIIREYDICLGDNPSCTYGPALSLSWKFNNTILSSVDAHEINRTGDRKKLVDMFVPSFTRNKMLLEEGYTYAQLQKTAVEVYREIEEQEKKNKGKDKSKNKIEGEYQMENKRNGKEKNLKTRARRISNALRLKPLCRGMPQ